MRGWLEPVGDAPANVYWFRRGMVFLVTGALLVASVWLAGRLAGGSGGPVTGTPSAAAPSGPVGTGVSEPSDGTAGSGTESPPPASVGSAESDQPVDAPGQLCRTAGLRVAIEGKNPLPVGEAVDFDVVIATTQQACILDLAQLPVTVTVTSGVDQIWTTANCPQWQPAGSFEIGAEQPVGFPVPWPNRRSSGCELAELRLPAGTYTAQLDVAGVAAQYVFQIV